MPPRVDQRPSASRSLGDHEGRIRALERVARRGPHTLNVIIEGAGTAITTGIKGDVQITFNCRITKATLLADQVGSIVIDIWKDSYGNYPPVVGDSICASAKPTISSDDSSTDSTLTGWTTRINSGDTLRFNVDSASTITRVCLALALEAV